jgi:hypothetical protein
VQEEKDRTRLRPAMRCHSSCRRHCHGINFIDSGWPFLDERHGLVSTATTLSENWQRSRARIWDQLLRSMPARNCLSARGPRNTWRFAAAAWLAMARMRMGRLRKRYATSHRQKSARSRDRRAARQAQRMSEKSNRIIVSAARSRTSTASYGPRSPSMIHPSVATSFSCKLTHSSRGVASRPARQKTLSSSISGSAVSSLNCLARVDLPEAPRPRTTTRFISSSVRHSERNLG